jgi:hypothetical protein
VWTRLIVFFIYVHLLNAFECTIGTFRDTFLLMRSNKNHVLHVRYSPEEKVLFDRLTSRHNRTLSGLVRTLLTQQADIEGLLDKPSEEKAKALAEVAWLDYKDKYVSATASPVELIVIKAKFMADYAP